MSRIDNLIDAGGQRWVKGEYDRIYFDIDNLLAIEKEGKRITRIDGVKLDFYPGKRLLQDLSSLKAYYDVKAEKFKVEGYGETKKIFSIVLAALEKIEHKEPVNII